MHLVPLTPICSGCVKWAATGESLTEYRLQAHSLLHQPVEQQAEGAQYPRPFEDNPACLNTTTCCV